VKNGEIVLNISYDATSGLKLGNDFIEFKARFSGSARGIMVPVNRVLAIYARENGQGMSFEAQPSVASDSAASSPSSSPAVGAAVSAGASPGLSPVAGVAPGASSAPASSVVALDPAATGKPSLRIVK
jgi:stringent starvation protein B